MTPRALLVYKEQKEQEDRARMIIADTTSWMTGAYVLRAIGCILDSKSEYPESNVFFTDSMTTELTEEEKEEIIKENTQIAAQNFAAWAEMANKSKK